MRTARAAVRVGVLAVLACSGSLGASESWTIPGIVNAGGLNGTHFVSDLTLTNPGATHANVTLSFFPSSAGPKALSLAPGQTTVAQDVVAGLFGLSGGAGALAVTSDQPLLIRARTYNTAASGTYGVALPVVASDRLLSAGDVADSLWITQDASGSSGYRTNIALVFPDESGGEATVTVYDADGNAVGRRDYSRDTPGLQQFSVGSIAGAVEVGRAEVQVLRGTAAGYAVVVDNVTGDSSLFAFEQLPAGWQDVLVNGVARANGRNGAFFRTDGRFYNPASTDATVKVSFHASGSSNLSPATSSFVLPAGKIRDVVDVLDSLLGLPVGSAGALRFQSNGPVAVLCRTSNVDPTGARPGTFGSQQKPVPLLSFVSSADAGASVTGIRQDAAFRTNVGFAAGPDGARYALTLSDASGAAVATASASLGAFGWTQPNVQDLFPTVTIPVNATLRVQVTDGSVDVFDSSIDNLSGDAVVTPIAPLPAAIPSSATIGPQGGSVRSDDGALTLKIPAGALGAPTPFSIKTVTNDAPGALGPAYDVSPGGLALAKPALLSLRYGTAGIPVSGIDAVSVAVLGSSGWGGLSGGRIDTTLRSLVIPLRNTSPSAVSAERRVRQAADQTPTRIAGSLSLEVVRQPWLPTGGKMTLEAKIRCVTPSSAGDSVSVYPIGPGSTSDHVTWGKPSIGSIGLDAGPRVTYTAPPTLGSSFVVVTASVKNYDPATNTDYGISFKFNVIRRKWALDLIFDANLKCQGSNHDFSVSYFSVADQEFRFNDDMTLVVNGPSTPLTGTPHVESCDPACKATVVAAPGDLQPSVVASNFLRENGFLLAGTATVADAIPTVYLKCEPDSASRTVGGAPYVQALPGYYPLSNSPQKSPSGPPGVPLWISGTWQSIP